tara:strand:+ start:643 stop:951 length:309 start_codon:yes stop_codon:yes gene_type:complete
MATNIVISNGDYIKVDDFMISWDEKGDSMPNLPHDQSDSIHYLIWNNLTGKNEIQKCNENHEMTSNVSLTSVSDVVVDTTTVQDFLNWGESRKAEIIAAQNS